MIPGILLLLVVVLFVVFYFRYPKFKQWLENNKIFFEVIAFGFLTAMAVIVSLEANRISSYQILLTKRQNQPIFKIDLKLDAGKETLSISNNGGPIHEFTCDSIVFYEIEKKPESIFEKNILKYLTMEDFYNPVPDNNQKFFRIPIYKYHLGIPNGNSTGELIALSESIAGSNYISARRAVLEMNVLPQYKNFCSRGILEYVLLKYQDVYDESHEDLYRVTPGFQMKVGEAEKQVILKDFETKKNNNQFVTPIISATILYQKALAIQKNIIQKPDWDLIEWQIKTAAKEKKLEKSMTEAEFKH